MNPLGPASGKDGGRQPSHIGKQVSVALGSPIVGTFPTVKTCKLANQVPLDRPRLARRLVWVTSLRNPSPVDARLDETTPISRRMAAQPSAGMSGPMDPNPVVVTVFPNEGYRYENS